MQDDVNMDPKPQPTGDDLPPGSGVEPTPTPPEADVVDNPAGPETGVKGPER